jgi:hypothetical protein
MKLPKVYLRDLISERLKFISPFEFIPRCPESRDLHFVPSNSGEFKYQMEDGQ